MNKKYSALQTVSLGFCAAAMALIIIMWLTGSKVFYYFGFGAIFCGAMAELTWKIDKRIKKK